MFRTNLTLFLFTVVGICSFAQEITKRDSDEIKLLAQRKVEKGLADLLNVLSQEDLGEAERKFMISDSYSDSKNRLFHSAEVIIEDDIQPDHINATAVMDLKVEKYLTNLDLFYVKGTQRSIIFSNFRVSNVKKTDYLYAKVFFDSQFKSKYSQSEKPYQPTRRMAEVRAEKNGKKWLITLSRIAFFSANDSLNSNQNDVVVQANPTAAPAEEDNQEISKERADASAAINQYNQLMGAGRKAFAEKNYEEALNAFSQADKINPLGDYLALVQISKVKRALTESLRTDDEIIKEFAAKAEVAKRRRNYGEAIDWYRKMLDKKPDSTNLSNMVKNLAEKDRMKAEFDEKFAAGRYKELVKDYDKVIKKEADNSDWYLGRGRSYFMQNDNDRALKDYNKSIELDFANIAALMARAELYKRTNNSPKAVADYSSILNIDRQNADVFAKRAAIRAQNSLSAAYDDYAKAIEYDNKNARYYYERGLLKLQNGKPEQALIDFSDASMRQDANPDNYFQRGMAYVALKKFAEAGTDFTKARALKLDTYSTNQIDTIAVRLFQIGQKAISNDNFSGAVGAYTNAIYINPKYTSAWFEKGEALTNMKQYIEATQAYSQAIKVSSDIPIFYFQRGWAWYNAGEYGKAVEDFRQTYDLNPDGYDALLNEARALIALEKYQEAFTPLKAIKDNQKRIEKKYETKFFVETYHFLGLCEYEMEQYEPAIDDYTTALKYNEKYADAYFNRGLAYETTGKLDRAIDDYQKSIEFEPNQAYKYLAKANALEKKGKFTEAYTDYNRVIDLDKENSLSNKALAGRGRCKYEGGKLADAAEDLEAALKIDATPDIYLSLGNVYTRLNDVANASKNYKNCIENSDKGVSSWGNYGMACLMIQQNKETEALPLFEAAFQTGKLSAEVVKKDRLLDAVKKDFRKNKDFKQLVSKYLK